MQSSHQFGPWSEVNLETWNDWRWQLKNAVRTIDELNNVLSSFTEFRVPSSPIVDKISQDLFEFKVTPYMILALKRGIEASIHGAIEAFRWTFTPSEMELPRIG